LIVVEVNIIVIEEVIVGISINWY